MRKYLSFIMYINIYTNVSYVFNMCVCVWEGFVYGWHWFTSSAMNARWQDVRWVATLPHPCLWPRRWINGLVVEKTYRKFVENGKPASSNHNMGIYKDNSRSFLPIFTLKQYVPMSSLLLRWMPNFTFGSLMQHGRCLTKRPSFWPCRPIMIYSNIFQWHSHRLHAWNRNMYQPYDLKYTVSQM